MTSKKRKQFHKELADVLAHIEDPGVMTSYLSDLLTPVEFDELAIRLQIIKRLLDGMPQRQIAEELGVGIATVTRGSRELKERNNGFARVLLHGSNKNKTV